MEIYRPRHKVRFHSVFFPLLSLLSFLNVSLFFIFTEIVEWEKKNMKNSSNFHFSLLKTGRRPYNVVSSFFSREYTVLQINSNLCKIFAALKSSQLRCNKHIKFRIDILIFSKQTVHFRWWTNLHSQERSLFAPHTRKWFRSCFLDADIFVPQGGCSRKVCNVHSWTNIFYFDKLSAQRCDMEDMEVFELKTISHIENWNYEN